MSLNKPKPKPTKQKKAKENRWALAIVSKNEPTVMFFHLQKNEDAKDSVDNFASKHKFIKCKELSFILVCLSFFMLLSYLLFYEIKITDCFLKSLLSKIKSWKCYVDFPQCYQSKWGWGWRSPGKPRLECSGTTRVTKPGRHEGPEEKLRFVIW